MKTTFKTERMNPIQIVAKLYNCRDTAKRYLREEYEVKIQPYKHIIKEVMKSNNVDELEALLMVSDTKTYQENKFGQMMFLAATVDLIEEMEGKE